MTQVWYAFQLDKSKMLRKAKGFCGWKSIGEYFEIFIGRIDSKLLYIIGEAENGNIMEETVRDVC